MEKYISYLYEAQKNMPTVSANLEREEWFFFLSFLSTDEYERKFNQLNNATIV